MFPGDLFVRLLDDCKDLGVRYINLAGGGEPLLHPDCAALFEEIANRKLKAILTTSGVLLTRFPEAACAAERVAVSTLAGSESGYREMHPNDSPDCWQKVLDGLGMLRQAGISTTINFVLCNRNYRDLGAVVDLAAAYRADLMINALIPFVRESEGKKRFDQNRLAELQLSGKQQQKLRDRCDDLERRARSKGVRMRGLRDSLTPAVSMPHENHNSSPEYSRGDVYDRQPCYTGWYFSRVLIDGTVTLCCHSLDSVALGNLHEKSFREIWSSREYNYLRTEGFKLPLRTSKLWQRCNCRICDDTERNQRIHRHLTGAGPAGKLVSAWRRFARSGMCGS
jgi:MoaA/NifB/PqqE/SkfB family radical SAM enzyme